MKSARQGAYDVLIKIQKEDSYSNILLDKLFSDNPHFDTRDRAFITNLVYGCLDRRIIIDYNLGLYLNQPVYKLKKELYTVLLMGAYQIYFMDKVPDRAAVNESVELAKANKSKFAASLVNAVLRRIADNEIKYPDVSKDSVEYLSVKYSCPQWILSLWIKAYGVENAEKIAQSTLESAPVIIRVNTAKTTTDELIWTLAAEGVVSHKVDCVDGALVLENCSDVVKLDSYEKGLFHLQDLASQLCIKAMAPGENNVIFDMCAAPGGKSFTAAQYVGKGGRVISFDVYQSRVNQIAQGAKRLGLDNIKAFLSDSTIYNEAFGKADIVLCDVPCSGLGVIRRKPEIKFKSAESIEQIPQIQSKILENSIRYLKPGGKLVYSTCTLNPAENEEVCEQFLAGHKNFRSIPVLGDISEKFERNNFVTLLPHLNASDGFFIACFEKTEE